jgi:hypothetical protein
MRNNDLVLVGAEGTDQQAQAIHAPVVDAPRSGSTQTDWPPAAGTGASAWFMHPPWGSGRTVTPTVGSFSSPPFRGLKLSLVFRTYAAAAAQARA